MTVRYGGRWRVLAALAITGTLAGLTGLTTATAAVIPEGAAAPQPIWKKYTPLIILATGESKMPLSAEDFIRRSSLRWSHDDGCSDDSLAAYSKVDMAALGRGGYKHQGKGGAPRCAHGGTTYASNGRVRPYNLASNSNEGMFLELSNSYRGGGSTKAPIYVDYVARSHITYWFHYAFSDSPGANIGDHEGDWERITIKLNASNVPTHTAYFRHNGSCILSWARTPKSAGHVIGYSARGSHATYPRPGNYRLAPGVYDVANGGAPWRTWLVTHYTVRQRPWYGFGGAWGEVGSASRTTGPVGPSAYKNPLPASWSGPPC